MSELIFTDFKTGKRVGFKDLPFERRCAMVELSKERDKDPEIKALQEHYEKENKAKTRRKRLAMKVLALRNEK